MANKIKKLRELKGSSQQYMAKKLGITQAAYSKMESNEKNLNFEKIEKISAILEIAPLDLLHFSDKLVFTNCTYNAVLGNNSTLYAYSERERELYESKIVDLKERIIFLENLVNKLM